MRAIVCNEFGSPDVLQVQEISVPEPGPGQVRVAIFATGINPVDAGNRQNGYWAGLNLPVILGSDASGVVDAVGTGVEVFKRGDGVYYMAEFLGNSSGTYAEYHVVNADVVAYKPKGLTHVQAASLPLAAGTAYETIVRRLVVTKGEWVLLYGAGGGVGRMALQMAASRGANVLAVARACRHELLQDLGAVACIDYTTQDVVTMAQDIAGGKVDVVVDLVGGQTVAQGLGAIRVGGRVASIASLEGDLNGLLDLNVTLHGVLVRPDQERLMIIDRLVSTGVVRPIVDHVLPLEEAADAHRRMEQEPGSGKIVLSVRKEI
jgi:NADPH:quinone reductase